MFRSVTANELGDNLASHWRPDMIDPIGPAHFFSVIERSWTVAVRNYVNMIRWEDLESGFESRTYDTSRFIARLQAVSYIT